VKQPLIIRSLRELRAQVWEWRGLGETIGFVPTMGALHKGHLSLISISNQNASKTIASIYVNPTQFAPEEDFGSYPRPEESDIEKLTAAGCDLIYIPDGSLYHEDHTTYMKVNGVGDGLETDHRPSFFEGVVLVVAKLLNRVQPDLAVFGEKDYQQLTIIRRMVRDLDMPIKIIGGPIALARKLNIFMTDCANSIENGGSVQGAIAATKTAILTAGFDSLDLFQNIPLPNLRDCLLSRGVRAFGF